MVQVINNLIKSININPCENPWTALNDGWMQFGAERSDFNIVKFCMNDC